MYCYCQIESVNLNPAPIKIKHFYLQVVFMYLDGGSDSFNMLVPHSGCSGGKSKCSLCFFASYMAFLFVSTRFHANLDFTDQ